MKTYSKVTDDFSVLFQLLEKRIGDVAGRSLTVPEDVKGKLAKSASVQCNDKERRELVRLLVRQPYLMNALVDEFDVLRGPSK